MHVIFLYLGALIDGGLKDVAVTVVSGAIALILGVLGALGRLYGGKVISTIVYWYVEVIRGLPAILQLFLIFLGLTQFGVNLSPLTAGMIWLVAYGTGYMVEVFRASIMEVGAGQHEAAAALGLDQRSSMRLVIIPQALVSMLPNLTTMMVLQLKNTTLLYLVGFADMTYQARLGADATSDPGPLYLVVAIEYLILAAIIGYFGRRMERRVAWYQ